MVSNSAMHALLACMLRSFASSKDHRSVTKTTHKLKLSRSYRRTCRRTGSRTYRVLQYHRACKLLAHAKTSMTSMSAGKRRGVAFV